MVWSQVFLSIPGIHSDNEISHLLWQWLSDRHLPRNRIWTASSNQNPLLISLRNGTVKEIVIVMKGYKYNNRCRMSYVIIFFEHPRYWVIWKVLDVYFRCKFDPRSSFYGLKINNYRQNQREMRCVWKYFII